MKLGDIVETTKGAEFWGEIIAIDSDEKNPGCTVRAFFPGFKGVKHVYPLAQLQHVPTSKRELYRELIDRYNYYTT